MITLASDFGSPYPAAMRGVLLSRTDARLVDVAHDFPRQDPRAAAFWLRETLPYFPPAVHLAVIDPGVGTDRDALVVRVGEHALVGPDNGLLLPVARRLARAHAAGDGGSETGDADPAAAIDAFAIDPAGLAPSRAWEASGSDAAGASSTFHGRDVFAPAAAAVHDAGVDALDSLDRLRPRSLDALVDLRFPTATVDDAGASGELLVVDGFGNAVTNVPGSALDAVDAVRVNGSDPVPVVEAFAAVDPGERLVTVGSHGYAECDVNRGRGADAFGFAPGDAVRLSFVRQGE